MKINKRFIDLLLQKREIQVSRLLDDEGLNYFVGKKLNNVVYPKEYNQNSLQSIEDIIYTVRFLINEKLVEPKTGYSAAMPSFGKLSATDFDRCEYVEEELEKIYGLILRAKLELFDYKERGYKTEKQIQELRNIWLPIIVAIIAASLTAVLTFLLNKYGSINSLLIILGVKGQIF